MPQAEGVKGMIRNNLSPYYERLADGEAEAAIVEFGALIDSDCSESILQAFLERHAYIVISSAPVYRHWLVVSQAALGSEFQADLAMYGSCNGPRWTLIELERPGDRIFNKNGDPSARLVHAMRQVRDWRQWIQDNTEYSCRTFGNHMGVKRSHIVTGIVIGRRSELSNSDKEHLLQLNREGDYNWIITFDAVADRARELLNTKAGTVVHKHAFPYGEFSRLQRELDMNSMIEDFFAMHYGCSET